jgi:hypothetical protein
MTYQYHEIPSFGRRRRDDPHRRNARLAAIAAGNVGLFFTFAALVAGMVDQPGAVLILAVAATAAILVAIAAASEA